ncbi:LPXTG cell wall anchor domain-containing protein [bacterium]|nr:MAG: LPXTG cell wall anchor domain-containing protein [bacterium]
MSETTIDGKHALTLTYTIIDNGELDLNPTAGTISDPIGLAVSNSTYDQLASTGENVYSLQLLAGILAALSIGITSIVVIRSRRRRG